MTSYILINAATRAPVPLPLHTETTAGVSVTIRDFDNSRVLSNYSGLSLWIRPEICGLAIITEADFMAEQEPRS